MPLDCDGAVGKILRPGDRSIVEWRGGNRAEELKWMMPSPGRGEDCRRRDLDRQRDIPWGDARATIGERASDHHRRGIGICDRAAESGETGRSIPNRRWGGRKRFGRPASLPS